MKCPVCKKHGYVLERGFCEKIEDEWITISRDKGHCSHCGFYYIEKSNNSFEEQVKKYKEIFIKKLTKKINKSK